MSPRPLLPPRLSNSPLTPSTFARSLPLWPDGMTQPTQADEAVEPNPAASLAAGAEAESTTPAPGSQALTGPDQPKDETAGPGQAAPESAAVEAKARSKRKLSAEHRAKISAANKGRTITAEHRAKLSEALKGHPMSAETRAKISAAHKGRPLAAEHRAKLSQALKGHAVSAETRAKISAANRGDRDPNYRHGAYAAPDHPVKTIEDVIADLSAKQGRLSALLDQELDSGEADTEYVIRLFSLHGQAASRLARLLRYQQAQASTPQDELSAPSTRRWMSWPKSGR